ncbi:MAG: hypothetical protein ACOX6H_02575 [Christensenellales bacterium]
MLLCFVLGLGGGVFVKDKFFSKEQALAFSAKEVTTAVNQAYVRLNGQTLITENPQNKYLAKTEGSNIEEIVKQENSSVAFLERQGSTLVHNNTTLQLKDLSKPVFNLINKLFEAGAYDVMSTTLLFEVRNAKVQPSNFDLKIKMVGYQNGIGVEYSISTEQSFIYETIYIGLDQDKNVETITYLSVQDTIMYGIYNVKDDKVLTLNPEYSGFGAAVNEMVNMSNVMRFTKGTLKTGIDIAAILWA